MAVPACSPFLRKRLRGIQSATAAASVKLILKMMLANMPGVGPWSPPTASMAASRLHADSVCCVLYLVPIEARLFTAAEQVITSEKDRNPW